MGAALKNIAIVSEDLSYPLDEGFKKASACLAMAIAGRGVSVSVFARRAEGLPLTACHLPANKLLLGSSFRRGLAGAKPQAVLYIPEAAATPMSLVRARMLKAYAKGAPVVVLSLQRRDYGRLAKPVLRYLAPALVLVLSERTRTAARAAGLNAETVPLGVDSRTFRPPAPGEKRSLREKYGIPDSKVILHVGHISPSRNLQLLRRVLAPGRHLAVVSSTSTRVHPEIKRELGGAPVSFLDQYIERIEEIYQLADCYAFPTFSELGAIEIPLSVLEAMAANLPVVTSDFGGLADVFQDRAACERQGLFMAASEDEFIDKLELALRLADVATRQLVGGLSWDRVAELVLERIADLFPRPAGEG